MTRYFTAALFYGVVAAFVAIHAPKGCGRKFEECVAKTSVNSRILEWMFSAVAPLLWKEKLV